MQATATTRQKRAKERPGKASESSASGGDRHQNEGHGRRLTQAFEALEGFPALAESCKRLVTVMSKDHVATADVVSAVESDVALVTAVLRMANRAPQARGRVETVVAAVEVLSPQTVQALAGRVRKFDFFERASVWDAAPERFRLHALATQHAADRVAAEVGYENRDRLTVTSLMHDIGKLVLDARLPGLPRAGAPGGADTGGAHPPGAPRAGRGPRARGRGARAAVGPAGVGGERDRTPPQRGGDGGGGVRAPRGHARPLHPGRPGLPGGDAAHRPHRGPRSRGAAQGDVRTAELQTASASATSIPARCRGASWACCSGSRRARCTSRSPTS